MAPAVRIFRQFRASDTRVKAATLTSLAGLVLALAFLVGVIPAIAGDGDPSGAGVQPSEIAYGGGSGACDADFPGLPSEAADELWINNPTDGRFTGPDGTVVTIDVYDNDTLFDFKFEDSTKAAYDVIVNGGSKNTHYDYDDGSTGPLPSDTALHAPTKGGSSNLYNLSHINICYDDNPFADLSVTKTPVAVNGTSTGNGTFVADVGDTVEFDIVVTNSSSSTVAATGVVVTDTLPTGMELTANGNEGWTPESDGTLSQTIESIAIGGSATLDLFVTITEDGAGSNLVNAVSVSANENDPTPNNDAADSVPPVTVTAEISGTKYHDRDTDGAQDLTEELGLSGWTITAFDIEGGGIADTTTTGEDGAYTLTLVPGDYVVCEQTTGAADLPDPGDGFIWSWGQSEPSGTEAGDCSDIEGYEPLGYEITVDGDMAGLDFGNHRQVAVTCGSEDVIVTLDGENDEPTATVTFPAGCQSGVGGNEPFTTSFDLGLSDDTDAWKQFVVFGGDPNSQQVLEQTIIWAPETATYVGGSLVVPTTQVLLDLGGTDPLEDVTFCHTDSALPDSDTPQCLDSRVIAEGSPLDPGDIQITETYKLLGDPGNFR